MITPPSFSSPSSNTEAATARFARASGWPLIILLLLFLVPGTLMRGPWKSEDAIYFGALWRAAERGDWLYFHLSATPLPEPPLYFWLSGAFLRAFQGILAAPSAARLATTAFMALALTALAFASRRLFDRPWAGTAPLALAGCLGLLIASHDVQPMTATLAAICILLYGLALLRPTAHFPPASWLAGTLVVSAGFATLLLSSGIRLLPVILLLAAVEGAREGRRAYVGAVLTGLAVGLALLAAWWWALYQVTPGAALTFVQHQFNKLMPHANAGQTFLTNLTTLSYWAWPAWPLAAFGLWRHRSRLSSPALLGPTLLFVGLLLSLSIVGESRQTWLILLLPPVALLAIPALMTLGRGGQALLDWFGKMTFSLLLLVLMLGWTALNFGWPSRWAAKAVRMAPGFQSTIDPLAFVAVVVVAGGWIWTLAKSRRSPRKSLFSWTGGLTVCWIAITALWLPWLDHQRSYVSVAKSIEAALPPQVNCLRTSGLSEVQYATIDFFLGTPIESRLQSTERCDAWLIQPGRDVSLPPSGNWQPLWEGARPGDKAERLILLFRR